MSRLRTRTSQFLIDIAVLMLAFFLAMLVRFDWNVPRLMFQQLMIVLPYVVLLQYAFLSGFGITRFSWRFISLRDTVRIFAAIASATAVLIACRLASPMLLDRFPLARYAIVPLGVLLGDFFLEFIGLTGVRALRRMLGERVASNSHKGEEEPPEPT
ncbi:MAG: hypothetical protein ACN4G0_08575, partial [Polyangiales bacterium]